MKGKTTKDNSNNKQPNYLCKEMIEFVKECKPLTQEQDINCWYDKMIEFKRMKMPLTQEDKKTIRQ